MNEILMCIRYDNEYVIYTEGLGEYFEVTNMLTGLGIEYEANEVTEERVWYIEWYDDIDEEWRYLWYTDEEEYKEYLGEIISAEVEYRTKIYN